MNTKAEAEFVVHPSSDRQFYFVLRAANHEVVLTSETYTRLKTPPSAVSKPYGRSQMYSSGSARNAGIVACQTAAAIAVVRELLGGQFDEFAACARRFDPRNLHE